MTAPSPPPVPPSDPRAAALSLDLSGQKVGEYQIIRRIGVGGMGAVFEGMQPMIGKRVALKFLLPALSQDQSLVERFLSEARAVNAIGHRGIVDIFSFGVHDQMQYFVMEYLEGRPFDRVIHDAAPMRPAEAVRYLEELLDALSAAHAKGVIHRDIKPSNIFLVESGTVKPYVKLLDFGIAKINAQQEGQTPQTRQSVVIGTPEYIAPEQAQGLAIGPQTDLYAVGCMAYEMLTGKLPFRGSNPLETMFKHVTEPTPHVRDKQPQVPEELDDIVFRMMAKLPQDRPRSVDEVSRLLLEAMGRVTAPMPKTPAPRTRITPDRAGGSGFAATFVRSTRDLVTPSTNELAAAALPKRRGGIVVALALVALAVGITVWAVGTPRGPPPQPLEVVPPPPSIVAPALPVALPPPMAPVAPEVVKTVPVAPIAPVVRPPPTAKGVTAAMLAKRLDQVEQKLEQRESQRGERLAAPRSVLVQLKKTIPTANTPDERKAIWDELGQLSDSIR